MNIKMFYHGHDFWGMRTMYDDIRYNASQKDLSKCLRYLKANCDSAIHITEYDTNNSEACIILAWDVFEDFECQILLVRDCKKWNVCDDRKMSFEKAKKEVMDLLFNSGDK